MLRTLVFCLLQTCLFTTIFAQKVAAVQASQRGGKYPSAVNLMLSCPTPGAVIRYTLDGSDPDAGDPIFQHSLLISTTSVLRARAFKTSYEPSPVLTETFFVGVNHSFPIISLAFEPSEYFDPTGLYNNPTQKIEVKTNFEFFENGAVGSAVNQLVETEIQGTASATNPQKSLEIKAKKSLGTPALDHPFFPNLPFENYQRLVLRNGGQDWGITQFRDEFATSLVADLSDLEVDLVQPALDLQAFRPTVAYLNGAYFGIHNLRERMNRFYIQQHKGLKNNEFDLVENFSAVLSGDSATWFQLTDWLATANLRLDADFQQFKSQVDYSNFLDYAVFNVFIENQDWPGNNLRRWRERAAAGRWRWLTYDLDYTFGLFQPGNWNTGDASPNSLARLFLSHSDVHPNPNWATLIFKKAWESPAFRRDFANRTADFLNTIFHPLRVGQRLDLFKKLYEPEMPLHLARWGFGADFMPVWVQNVEKMRRFSLDRPQFLRQHIEGAMSEATGSALLTLNVAPPDGGSLRVSTIGLERENLPWTGRYFTGIEVPLRAVAAPGFEFLGWSDASLGKDSTVNLRLSSEKSLIAIFQKKSNEPVAPCQFSDKHFLKILPNPSAGKFEICLRDAAIGQDVQALVFNSIGQQIWAQKFSAVATPQVSIDLAGLPSAHYYLFLRIGDDRPHPAVLTIVR